MNQDINERLVDPNSNQFFDKVMRANRFVIEACELQGLQVGYTPDGSVCTETYSFFARDLIIA